MDDKNTDDGSFSVFVYGTLLPGFGNHSLVSLYCIGSEPAKLFGAGVWHGPGYPYMLTAANSDGEVTAEDAVQGALLHFYEEDRVAVLRRLDQLEGYREGSAYNHYNRIKVSAISDEDGRTIGAFAYEAGAGAVRPTSTRVLTRTLPDGGVLGDWAATRR